MAPAVHYERLAPEGATCDGLGGIRDQALLMVKPGAGRAPPFSQADGQRRAAAVRRPCRTSCRRFHCCDARRGSSAKCRGQSTNGISIFVRAR